MSESEIIANFYKLQGNIDTLWVLVSAFMVFLMQAGFLCVETGLVRFKNTINVALKNIVDFGLSVVVFWAFGFGLMFGTSYHGFFGTNFFFLTTSFAAHQVHFIFQAMFVATAATIISGAVAERLKFKGYAIITILTSGIIYPIVGHWGWAAGFRDGIMNPGWLIKIGFVDFAGSTIVHSVGGWVALAAIMIIGPRIGRFDKGVKNKTIGSNYPVAILGTLILWFGWFGFNGGSNGKIDLTVPTIIINTFLGGAFGLITSIIYSSVIEKLLKPKYMILGPLAGLVSVTANCNVISQPIAMLIGSIGALLAIYCDKLLEKFKLDDVVGAIPVHLAAGIWGTIATGIFGPISGEMIVDNRLEFIIVQIIGVVSVGLFCFTSSYLILALINKFFPLRISAINEEVGLNISEHNSSTDEIELINIMDEQTKSGNLNLRTPQNPFTNAGIIGTYYNKMLNKLEKSEADREKWRSRVTNEINLATEVQNSFVPKRDLAKFPVAAYNIPARELSGDFYSFFPKNDGIYFIIADVSGKGINAAMVMAKAITLFEIFARNSYSLEEIALQMNNDIYDTKTRGMFITSILGEYKLDTKEVTWINCGHITPVVKNKENEFEDITDESSQPLGLIRVKQSTNYTINNMILDNKRIYLFTDGITESLDDQGNEMGVEGTQKLIKNKSNSNIKKEVKNVVTEITTNQSLKDDITIIAIGE